MKTLCIVRHAKSTRDDPDLPDRERPLAERGIRDVARMGKRLAKRGVAPDLILSSPALRALDTARAIAKALDYRRRDILVNERLYACEADDLLDVVRALDERHDYVMLVGHNPELTEFAHRLASAIEHLPTCAVAEFAFATDAWTDVGRLAPERAGLECPKDS